MTAPPSPLAAPLAWNLVAAAYADEIVPTFELFARDALRLTGVQPGARVLDVACGPGTLSLVAAATASQVTAIDFAAEMVAKLRARIAAAGVTNVEAREGDGQALDLPDASFDAAFSMFGLMFFPDRARGLRELRRVLAPGGAVAISSWLPMSEVPLMSAVFDAVRAAVPGPLGDPKPPLGAAEEVEAELGAAGFREAAAHRVTYSFEYPHPSAFAESTLRTLAPVVLLRHKLGDAAFAPIAAAIRARVIEVGGEGPGRVEMAAWIGVGRV